jgi:hypothetical protein
MQTNEPIKTISFEGTNNRYQIKKLTEEKNTPKIKKDVQKWDFSCDIYSLSMQRKFLRELHEDDELCRESVIAKREIEKKIQGYKQQDLNKCRFLEKTFVDFKHVITELYNADLLCYYCSCFVFLIYEHVRETDQWTLDRIDNSIGHNRGNVVISCLKCNLKRRKTNQNAFLFSKNLNLIKMVDDHKLD